MTDEKIQEALDAVEEANLFIVDSQANADPQHYQRAQKQLTTAKEMLHEVIQESNLSNETDALKVKHAQELLKHLNLIQQSLQ